MDWPLVTGVIYLLNTLFAIIVIFFERRNPTATLAWLMVLFFLPLVGFVLYLFLGQNYTRQRLFTLKAKDDATLRSIFEEQHRRFLESQHRFSNPEAERYRDVILALLRRNRAFLTEGNRVEIYTDGSELFDALFAAIRDARHHIHLEYFIVNNDELGREVVHALAAKAAEGGLEVRLLFDALGGTGRGGRVAGCVPGTDRCRRPDRRFLPLGLPDQLPQP